MDTAKIAIVAGFHLFIVAMLAVDLGVFRRKAAVVSTKEAAGWTAVWVTLAMTFAAGIWKLWHLWEPANGHEGPEKAVAFVTGYLLEFSLSVDNLFVFLVIFRYFGVPHHLRHRVLLWGIVGAVIMRAFFIGVGYVLLTVFHWMIYVFGALLIYTGYKLSRSVEEEIDPGKNPVLRLARRFLPIIDSYDSPRFWVHREGRWHSTPLLLVLLVVETTDVVFALDSIPAIFGITDDPFIVYTSNIFAILGLRSLYFLLANFLGMFRYLSVGLAAVLIFIGVKMIAQEWFKAWLGAHGVKEMYMTVGSLAVIATILAVAVVASILAGPKEPLEHVPDEVALVVPPELGQEGEPERE